MKTGSPPDSYRNVRALVVVALSQANAKDPIPTQPTVSN
jgi:hypothetical protein